MKVRAWWLVPSVAGLLGYLLSVADFGGDPRALSQEASLAACIGYAVAAALGPGPAALWVRGALATVLGLVGGTWILLLGGDYSEPWSLLEHLVTPALVIGDVLVVSPLLGDRTRGRWWWSVTWLVLPLAYLLAYVVGDFALYDFLDPGDPSFAPTVLGFLAGTLIWAAVLLGTRNLLVPSRPSAYSRDIS